MSRVFVIADLHLGHHLVAKLRGFDNVFAHDNAIVENWNRVVTKRDVVYVLGDVFRLDRLPEMRGYKKLAMGNHDKFPAARYAEHFTKVAACYEFDGCILTHIPVHPNQFGRYRLNVHGHMHAHCIDDPRYVCVSAERVGMTPTLLGPSINARDVKIELQEQWDANCPADLLDARQETHPHNSEYAHGDDDGN